MNNLNELSKQIYEGNKLRGFDVSKENIGTNFNACSFRTCRGFRRLTEKREICKFKEGV